MKIKTSIPLTKGEWNTVLHALNYKTMDRNNSPTAQKQYQGLYDKLVDLCQDLK